MGIRITQLHCKEVICISDGRRLGYITDVEIDISCGKVLAIVVPGPCRILGVCGRADDYVIAWDKICKIGPDIVLVDIKPDDCRFPRHKFNLPF
jgi:YlmC/YmxH family sporulation protein